MPIEWFIDFAKALLKDKGINVPEEEVQKQLETDLATRVRDAVLRGLVNNLSEAEAQELDKALNEGDEEKAKKIVDDKQDVITQVMANFRGVYLGVK